LHAEDIAIFAFHNASSALRDLKFERTTEEKALIKFQQAHSVIELAEELLHRAQLKNDVSSESDTRQREDLQQQLEKEHLLLLQRNQPIVDARPELNEEQREDLQRQLETAEGQLRDLQRQVATDKENKRKLTTSQR
jgi:hypothetical protein